MMTTVMMIIRKEITASFAGRIKGTEKVREEKNIIFLSAPLLIFFMHHKNNVFPANEDRPVADVY